MTAVEERPSETSDGATSSTLYTYDLAPTKREGRRWGAYNVFTLWANDVHSLGNYAFAIGLFALGLNVWGILAAFLLASVLLFLLLTLSGFMGHKTGVPFPVMSRIAFGIRGAKIPAAVRGLVAIAWFGIQTYLASAVLSALLIAMFPGLRDLDTNSVLGQSTLGWITFLALWALQLLIVSYGMQMIRRYMAFAAPTTLITMCALAVWMFVRADWSISVSVDAPLVGGEMWLQILQAAALWVVIYGTFVLNFCDFTRSAKSRGSIIWGNVIGIPVNMIFFAVIVIVLSGAQFTLDGHVITSPTDIVRTIPNMFLLATASLALIALTVAVNLLANFVAPIYALIDLFPRRLNFRRAGVVSAVAGLVILPWNLYNSPVVVNYFLGGLGALLGPLFGVIMADYWLLRRSRVNVPALYSEDPTADYHYRRGVNPRAIAAFAPSATVAVVIALVPFFHAAAGFSWFIGAILAAALYALIADRTSAMSDVDGEAIAVAAE
ncbi:nitrate reductase [Streptomyces sp. TSRI0445]|uniref:Hydantoin permease n=1 Tax=Streptomyces globisporus TaxID=1908 RepID=A0ABM9H0B4_STRGL|nr:MULTISPECIES: NCS1 family nucleobase:cation symporter-1 [Streptomyces]PPA38720.1 nitrate reductase [Streptomyces griseus]RAN16141.1 nitrate reductase [Streptomyces badius]AWL84934.1 nitrate reductase [Streptomyces globisporus]OKI68242.1 nitrate reductase [Streptomyces sp. TSRI0445]RAN23998.1 nitrate reductase [Streptomyces badius]